MSACSSLARDSLSEITLLGASVARGRSDRNADIRRRLVAKKRVDLLCPPATLLVRDPCVLRRPPRCVSDRSWVAGRSYSPRWSLLGFAPRRCGPALLLPGGHRLAVTGWRSRAWRSRARGPGGAGGGGHGSGGSRVRRATGPAGHGPAVTGSVLLIRDGHVPGGNRAGGHRPAPLLLDGHGRRSPDLAVTGSALHGPRSWGEPATSCALGPRRSASRACFEDPPLRFIAIWRTSSRDYHGHPRLHRAKAGHGEPARCPGHHCRR